MFIFGLFLKTLYKLRLGRLMYPVLKLLIDLVPSTHLPSKYESRRIINNNTNKKYNSVNVQSKYNHKLNGNYDLQIIVPVYNSEKYIQSCLNSILNQRTKFSFQIIVIDDGSTDNTKYILSRYKGNKLIKIIYRHNKGRSEARNVGLNYVTSKHVMFVDSDDKLAPHAIQYLLNNAYKTDSDIVFGGHYVLYNNGHVHMGKKYVNNSNLTISSIDDVDDSVWGKVFKTKLFKTIRFPVSYEFEDMMLAFWIYPLCKKMSSISYNTYFYRYNPLGITHSFQFTKVSIDSFLMLYLMISSLSTLNIKISQYIYNTFLSQVKITCMRNIYINSKIQKSIFVLICSLFNHYFNGYHTNLSYYYPLEYSIKNKDYNKYILFCIMR